MLSLLLSRATKTRLWVEFCYRVGAEGGRKKDAATQTSVKGITKVSWRPREAIWGYVLEKACHGPQRKTTAELPLWGSASCPSHPLSFSPVSQARPRQNTSSMQMRGTNIELVLSFKQINISLSLSYDHPRDKTPQDHGIFWAVPKLKEFIKSRQHS